MMSEHKITVKKETVLAYDIGLTESFIIAQEILKTVPSCDVRWKHVERARCIYETLRGMFEESKLSCKED